MLAAQNTGFLLLEACLSILILGVFAYVIASWHMNLIQAEQEIAHRMDAVMLAQSLIEEYKALGKIPKIKKQANFSVVWDAQSDEKIAHFMHVALTIGGEGKSFTLKTGFLVNAQRNKSS